MTASLPVSRESLPALLPAIGTQARPGQTSKLGRHAHISPETSAPRYRRTLNLRLREGAEQSSGRLSSPPGALFG